MSPQSGLARVEVSAAESTSRAAAAIVGALHARLPDLRDAVVLIPDLHAAPAVARALRAAAAVPTLLLPLITTLAEWAASIPLERPVATRSAREATLYTALAARAWLRGADLWSMASELAGLFDEMIRHNVALAHDLADFAMRLEAAYRARPGSSLRFEAQLVHELWWAMSRDAGELAPAAAFQLRLARLADRASQPIFAIGLDRLAPVDRAFLERYASRAPVTVFEAVADRRDPLATTLDTAWVSHDAPELRVRAQKLRELHPRSALAGRLRVFGAAGAEQEAQAIDVAVREWLLAGKRSIAVVLQDRVVARRARALLERAAVLVTDEAGWALSTTSAATALGRWLDIVANDAHHQDMFDLMKSPFAFHDWPRDARREVVWRLERYARKANVVGGIDRYLALAQRRDDAEATQLLRRVQRGLALLPRNRKPLSGWLAALDASMAEIGVRAGLEADPAGEQLLDMLAVLARELAASDVAFSFGEWRRWLARELEGATFHDRCIESPVIFTYLAATRLRRFDAVVICGCDAQHLPGPDPVSRLFNHSVRADLGLPTRTDELRDLERQLAGLIQQSPEILLTWQRQLGGEPNLFSPVLDRLLALERLAHGNDLTDYALAARLPHSQVTHVRPGPLPAAAERPRPAAAHDLLPLEISASAYNALVACPYQFYARYMLGLGELDEVQDLIDKSDYGSLLHGVLARFHRTYPVVSTIAADEVERALRAFSAQAFEEAVANNYLARAWLMQWQALIPAYLEWQSAREAEGWRWHSSETRQRIEIDTPDGRRLAVVGRLDRVDVHADGRVAVIDYKTTREKSLVDKLKEPGEDVQLPLYALLWGGPVAQALFLALESAGVKPVHAKDLERLAAETGARLGRMYDELHTGAALPAHGIETVCQYCEARGLCRKDYWP